MQPKEPKSFESTADGPPTACSNLCSCSPSLRFSIRAQLQQSYFLKPWNQQKQYATGQGNHFVRNKTRLRWSKTLIVQISSAHTDTRILSETHHLPLRVGKNYFGSPSPYDLTTQVLLILNHLQSYSSITLTNVTEPSDFQQFSDSINLNFLYCNVIHGHFYSSGSYCTSSCSPFSPEFTQVKANRWKEVK